LQRLEVERVEIGPLFAIHFDVDEALVHQRGDLGILEALAGHHMAPMAGRVADAQQDRFVEGLCLAQGRLAPWQPVHRVAPMLTQVGAALLSQTVDHARLYTVFILRDKAGASPPYARSAA
jgi:hypothetical protein